MSMIPLPTYKPLNTSPKPSNMVSADDDSGIPFCRPRFCHAETTVDGTVHQPKLATSSRCNRQTVNGTVRWPKLATGSCCNWQTQALRDDGSDNAPCL